MKLYSHPGGTVLEGPAAEIDEFLRRQAGTYGTAPVWVTNDLHQPNCEVTKAAGGWWSINPPSCTCSGRVSVTVTGSETIK